MDELAREARVEAAVKEEEAVAQREWAVPLLAEMQRLLASPPE
jgi:hypothetical protein